jgi:glutamate N-acetyltransferase/amino-acid N-acetyltransferase
MVKLGMIIPGFQFAATAAGIKKTGDPDLALMLADQPATAAGVFTRNRVKAAPVLLSRERLRSGKAQAILANSGNANAATGEAGLAAARATTGLVAELLHLPERFVLAASTGVIGQRLPAAKIEAAVPELVARLAPDGLPLVAQAIMTTDTRPKTAHLQVKIGGKEVSLAGIAKGAGMIHPDLATLLVFVFTDAAVSPPAMKKLLRQALPVSFNRITVDGDTSTNDTILWLASGAAGNDLIRGEGPSLAALGEGLNQVLADLARQVVADGEGAEHVYRVEVQGAASAGEALAAARTVALSPLVKTAMAGADVNWGRILAALGRSGARFDPEKVDIAFGHYPVAKGGLALGEAAEAEAKKLIQSGAFTIHINLNAGSFSDYYLTCDFTEDYIRINASYRS